VNEFKSLNYEALGEDISWRLFWLNRNLVTFGQHSSLESAGDWNWVGLKWDDEKHGDHEHCAGCMMTIWSRPNEKADSTEFGWFDYEDTELWRDTLCNNCHQILLDIRDGVIIPVPKHGDQ